MTSFKKKTKEQQITEATSLRNKITELEKELKGYRKLCDSLKESEQQLSSLCEATFEGIGITEKGVIIYSNQQFADMFGYEQSEIIGKSVIDLVATEHHALVLQHIKKGYQKAYEHIGIKKDGSRIYIEVRGKQIKYQGRLVRETVIRDITERKQNESRYKEVVEGTGDLITRVDSQGNFIYVNHMGEKVFGIDIEKCQGMSAFKFIHTDDQLKTEKWFNECIRKKIPQTSIENRQVNQKTGKVSHMLWTTNFFYDKDGQISGVNGIARDITERKKAKEALKALATTFSARTGEKLFEDISNHIATALNIDYAFIGELVEGKDRVKVLGGFAKGEKMELFEYNLAETPCENVVGQEMCIYSSGITKLFPKDLLLQEMGIESYIGSPLFDREGEALGIMVIMDSKPQEDIAVAENLFKIFQERVSVEIEREQAEKKLKQHKDHLEVMVQERTVELELSNNYLEEAVKELETFSYSISHDLKAPLRAISGYSGMLHQDYSGSLDEEGNRLLNVINDNAVQMGQLIEDILQYSRMVRRPLEKGEVHIKKLTEGVILELEGEYKDRDIEINVQEMPNCNGDSVMIKQVLMNLVSNAIKYTGNKEKAKIEVGSKQIDNETVYYVKDNGVGFDMKYSDKLFGLFQRLHSKKEFEGTGVGLAIVQTLVNKHRGKIWADAKVNVGAIFYFSL